MTSGLVEEITRPKLAAWVELANAELNELEAAAKADAKGFYGNRQRGKGAGQSRVETLVLATRGILTRLNSIDRGT